MLIFQKFSLNTPLERAFRNLAVEYADCRAREIASKGFADCSDRKIPRSTLLSRFAVL